MASFNIASGSWTAGVAGASMLVSTSRRPLTSLETASLFTTVYTVSHLQLLAIQHLPQANWAEHHQRGARGPRPPLHSLFVLSHVARLDSGDKARFDAMVAMVAMERRVPLGLTYLFCGEAGAKPRS
jgi:hypothetical protein